MATIIDSLLVKLGLDSSEFDAKKSKVDKGLKATGSEADKTGAKLKKSGKDGAEGFENVAKSAAKFLALIGGTMAVKRFAQDMIESSAALDRFSKNLGSNVETVTAWGSAAEVAGGSASGLQNTMSMLSKAQTQLMLTGESNLIPYLSALGVSMADVTTGKARPLNDMLMNIGQSLLARTPDRQTAFNMGQMMGIDADTLNLILRERKEVEALLKQQAEYAAAMRKFAPDASKLNRMMVEGKQAFSLFGLELLQRAVPALEKMFAIFADFGSWIQENKEFVQTFLTIIAAGLGAIALATIPVNLTVVAVLALSAAIAALWQDYQTWKRGGDSFIDWSKWEPGFKAATAGIKRLKEMMVDIMYVAIAGADALIKFFSGDFEGAKIAGKAFWEGREKPTDAPTPAAAAPGSPAPAAGGGTVNSTGKSAAGGSKEEQARLTALEQKYGLPAGILDNVWKTESGRGRNMTSPAGAQGHFQFMPATAAQYGLKNPNDFNESSDAAARMYRDLLKANGGDVSKAAAAYNWGQGNLNRKGMGAAPTETLNYINKVTSGIGGASQAAAGAGAGQVAQANAAAAPGASSKSVETHIGEVKVYTAATDANGIAKDMGKSLDYLFTSQANYGLT